jgi:hypothetical protein
MFNVRDSIMFLTRIPQYLATVREVNTNYKPKRHGKKGNKLGILNGGHVTISEAEEAWLDK